MNLAPKARGEAVAAQFCAFHGHKIDDATAPGFFSHDHLFCVQCGATMKEIREPSPAAVSASEHLTVNAAGGVLIRKAGEADSVMINNLSELVRHMESSVKLTDHLRQLRAERKKDPNFKGCNFCFDTAIGELKDGTEVPCPDCNGLCT